MILLGILNKWRVPLTPASVKGNHSTHESESCTVMSDFLRPPWTTQSMEFSRPENTGVGSLSSSPEDLPNPGIEPRSPASQTPLIVMGRPRQVCVLPSDPVSTI